MTKLYNHYKADNSLSVDVYIYCIYLHSVVAVIVVVFVTRLHSTQSFQT